MSRAKNDPAVGIGSGFFGSVKQCNRSNREQPEQKWVRLHEKVSSIKGYKLNATEATEISYKVF